MEAAETGKNISMQFGYFLSQKHLDSSPEKKKKHPKKFQVAGVPSIFLHENQRISNSEKKQRISNDTFLSFSLFFLKKHKP